MDSRVRGWMKQQPEAHIDTEEMPVIPIRHLVATWLRRHGKAVQAPLTQTQKETFEQMFNLIDQDGGGTLDTDELGEAFDFMGVENWDVDGLMNIVENNGSGEVDFQEFVDLMTTGLRQMIEEALERGEDFVRTEFEILGSAFRRRKLLQAINQTDQLARTLLFEKAKTDSQAARRRNKERENAKAEKRLRDLSKPRVGILRNVTKMIDTLDERRENTLALREKRSAALHKRSARLTTERAKQRQLALDLHEYAETQQPPVRPASRPTSGRRPAAAAAASLAAEAARAAAARKGLDRPGAMVTVHRPTMAGVRGGGEHRQQLQRSSHSYLARVKADTLRSPRSASARDSGAPRTHRAASSGGSRPDSAALAVWSAASPARASSPQPQTFARASSGTDVATSLGGVHTRPPIARSTDNRPQLQRQRAGRDAPYSARLSAATLPYSTLRAENWRASPSFNVLTRSPGTPTAGARVLQQGPHSRGEMQVAAAPRAPSVSRSTTSTPTPLPTPIATRPASQSSHYASAYTQYRRSFTPDPTKSTSPSMRAAESPRAQSAVPWANPLMYRHSPAAVLLRDSAASARSHRASPVRAASPLVLLRR